MLTYRNANIFFILFTLIWIFLDSRRGFSPAAYGWILLVYVSVLFCGSYFIRMGFFIKSINTADGAGKEVALSFDDGPAIEYTPAMLDILKEKDVETIFFCIGKRIPGNEALLKRIVDEGHIIGNHSYSHHHFFDLFGSGKMLSDLQAMNAAVQVVTGRQPRLFRPPYGVTNPNLKKAIVRGGFTAVGWSVRSFDTVIRDENRLKQKILGALKPGAIILLHDTSPATANILSDLIAGIRQQGYRIVRLDKMLKLNPYA